MRTSRVQPILISIRNIIWKPNEESEETGNKICKTTDELLKTIGISNKYILFIITSMGLIWGLTSMSIMASAFIARDVSKICEDSPNCTQYSRKFYSVTDAFNLNESFLNNPEWLNSAFFLGNSIGGSILSPLSDRIGRKVLVAPAVFFLGFFGVLSAFSSRYWLLILARSAQGFFFTTTSLTNFILASESIHNVFHARAQLIFGVFWVLGYLAIAPIAYITRSWKGTMIIISLPSCVYGIFLWLTIPESLQFMILRKQTKGIENWIGKVKKFSKNKKNIDYDLKEILASEETNNSIDTSEHFFTILIKKKKILLYLVCLFFIWFVDFVVYNGISYLSTSLHSDAYLAYILSGIVELPAYIIGPYLLDKFGRKITMFLSHSSTGVFLISLLLLNPGSVLHLIFWLSAKLATTCCFVSIFVYSSEIFPIEIRNTCLAACAMASNLGAIVAPHSINLELIHTDLASATFGAISLIATALLLFLPETRNQKH